MISLQKLQQAMSESREFGSVIPIKRNEYLSWLEKSMNNRLIKAVVGFRRSGKSFLLKILSKSLIDRGTLSSNIFYLNFENDLLSNIKTVQHLRNIWEEYLREIADPDHPIYIIWDEIQLISGWEKLVRSLYEQGKYNIYVSGSNSNLLSGELSSSLSGRSLQLEIKPFSFREYLDYRGIKSDSYYCEKQKIDRAFSVYMQRGGIAEQFGLEEPFVSNYQSGLIQKIILDDIVKRYSIDNVNILQEVFEFICGNITSTISLRKIVNRFDEQGLKVSTTTIDNYIGYWQTSYAVEKLNKFDYRLSRVFDRTSKYYCIDNLLIKGREESNEKRLENLVYIELTRRYGRKNVFFGQDQNGYEIDFVVKNDNKFMFFQVCMVLNDKNVKREFGNLELINKYLKGQGTVLFLDDARSNPDSGSCTSVIEWLINYSSVPLITR
ncbi:ATP-binding protein [Candidatus Microgenomates bacterium]|nr:ATP-binding protein [Candidatus Microgenomates bacterium]